VLLLWQSKIWRTFIWPQSIMILACEQSGVQTCAFHFPL